MVEKKRIKYLFFSSLGAGLLLLSYILVSKWQPFSEFWNIFFIDGLITLVAALAAISASRLNSMFERGDQPRRIWTHFASALWIWMLAEAAWMLLELFVGEFEFSVADSFWLLGYVFFAIAISAQYRILYRWSRQKQLLFLFGGLGITTILSLAGGLITAGKFDFIVIVWYFYPIADIALAFAVLALLIAFRGSSLAAPWIGLFVLIISDILYLWAVTTEFYWITGGMPRLLVDSTYVFAYLVFALGCYSQYLLYRFSQD
jgi:hypothetical protein